MIVNTKNCLVFMILIKEEETFCYLFDFAKIQGKKLIFALNPTTKLYKCKI